MHDQLLAAVKAQLERIEATGDLALALEPGAFNDACRLAEVLDDGDVEVPYVLGWFHWYRYLALPQGQNHDALEEATRVLTLCFITGVEGLPESLLPRLADNSIDVATHLLEQATNTSDLTFVTVMVSLWQRVVAITPVDHPAWAARLSDLGLALQMRFERVGVQADLNEAITVGRAAAQATPVDHPDRAGRLSNLGLALRMRFERVGARADLDEAIMVSREAVQASANDYPNRAAMLSNLSIALQVQFRQAGGLADLDEAVTVGRAAVQIIPMDHPDRAGLLSNLGLALRVRFERTGARTDLDEAITVSRAAVHATPVDHPDLAGRLSNLGVALRVRFERVGARTDLDEAVNMYVLAGEVLSGAPSVRIHAARLAALLAAQTDTRRVSGLLETAVRLLPGTASRRLDRGDQQYALSKFAGLANDAAALALADEADARGESAARALRLLELGRGVMLSQALDTRSDLTDLQVHHPSLAARFVELRNQFDQAGSTLVAIGDADAADGQEQRRCPA